MHNINLILLTAHGRSGSLLIHSLFDGHPQIASLPVFGINYSEVPEFTSTPLETVNELIRRHPELLEPNLGYLGNVGQMVTRDLKDENRNNLCIDKDVFKQIFRELVSPLGSPISRKDLYIYLYKSYYIASGRSFDEIRYIFFHQHKYSSFSHELALEDFPGLKYISPVRDPRENWLSWEKVLKLRANGRYNSRQRLIDLNCTIGGFQASIENLYRFSRKVRSSCLLVIDLNRLHLLNERAITRICDFLEISDCPILHISTFGGITWHGNAADRTSITGLDASMSQHKWPKRLDPKEAILISSVLQNCIRFLNYSTADTSGPRFSLVPIYLIIQECISLSVRKSKEVFRRPAPKRLQMIPGYFLWPFKALLAIQASFKSMHRIIRYMNVKNSRLLGHNSLDKSVFL